jgi:hypothetical protein
MNNLHPIFQTILEPFMHDRPSELRQEAHDRACKRFDSGDFDVETDVWFFNRPDLRKALKKALMDKDHIQAGKIVENALYLTLLEQEDD